MSTTVAWKVLTRTKRRIASTADASSLAFRGEPNPGIYTQYSLPLSHAYVPLALIPTATYHQVLRNRLERLGFEWPSRKPAYMVSLPPIGEARLSLKFRVYPPGILAITFRFNFDSDVLLNRDFDNLLALRFPLSVAVIREVASFTAGIIDSGDHRDPTPGLQLVAYTGYHLHPVVHGEEMQPFLAAEVKQLTALLLGIKRWQRMSDDLVTNIKAQNEELNKKDTDELLLLNKQGLVLLSPSADSAAHEASRFDHTLDLVEIGRIFQYFLDDFTHIRLNEEDFADYIFAQIQAWLNRPAAIWASSYTGQLAWDMVVRAFRLSEKSSLVNDSLPNLAREIEEKRDFFAQAADRWWEKPEFATVFGFSRLQSSLCLEKYK